MHKFIYHDDPAPETAVTPETDPASEPEAAPEITPVPEPEPTPGESGEAAEGDAASAPDYTAQLEQLYEYIVDRDNRQMELQEEQYAACTEQLKAMDTGLQSIYQTLDWILAMLVLFAVLILCRSVRRWTRTIGGSKNVQ